MDGKYVNKIKEIRNQSGLTQIQLAERLNITQSALSKIEQKDDPPISIVFKISDAFGIPVTSIYSKQ